MIEARHLVGRQRQTRDRVFAVAVLDLDDPFEVRVGGIVSQLPGDPGTFVHTAEKPLQGRHDPVGALVFPENDLAVFFNLFIRLAVVDDDEIAGHVSVSFR